MEDEKSYYGPEGLRQMVEEDPPATTTTTTTTRLTLFACGLESLRGVPLSPKLRSLALCSNELGPVLELDFLRLLEELDVSSNRYRFLRGTLPRLKKLVVAYNEFSTLRGLEIFAPRLENLDARHNPLEERPAMVLKTALLPEPSLKQKTESLERDVDELRRKLLRHRVLLGVTSFLGSARALSRMRIAIERWRSCTQLEAVIKAQTMAKESELCALRREMEEAHADATKKAKEELRAFKEESETLATALKTENARLSAEVEGFKKKQQETTARREIIEATALAAARCEVAALRRSAARDRRRIDEIEARSRAADRVAATMAFESAARCEQWRRAAAAESRRLDAETARSALSSARDASARRQLGELRAAFERAAVATAESKAAASAAESAKKEMAARLAEVADLARDQRAALSVVRAERDRERRGRAADHQNCILNLRKELEEQALSLSASARRKSQEMEEMCDARVEKAEKARVEATDAFLAAQACGSALLTECRAHARRLVVATEAAEAARDEASRRDDLAHDLSTQLEHARQDNRDLSDENSRLREARDSLHHDRELLRSDLDRAEARLKAQTDVERHLRLAIADLRKMRPLTATNL